ncbi:hypothetical protein FBQ82_18960 [Anaerolineae bacterium CFX7]|nr:hypothetical protein [Anaerolineae bacterium CFX7]
MQESNWETKLTADMQRVLTPVQPSDSFRKHLKTNLQLAGQQHAARRAMRLRRPRQVNYWVMGAAAFGLTVAAGSVIAWAVRARLLWH